MSNLINVAETFNLSEDQSLSGTSPLVRRNPSPQRAQAIVEAAGLWGRVFGGDMRAALQVREALSTSDLFKSVTGDVLDRQLLAQYEAITPEWQKFATRVVVPNFKAKTFVDLLGGRTKLEAVPELTAYPGGKIGSSEASVKVSKFGRQFGYSWESLINDDLGELQRIPAVFAEASSLTETANALAVIAVEGTGAPNTAFFKDYSSAGGPNTTPATAALSHDSLQAGITAVTQRKDSDGNIIPAPPLTLVVGPALQFTAEAILAATEVRTTVGSKTVLGPNLLRGKVTLQVVSSLAGSAWFIVPTPSEARPAIVAGFLRGFETPDIRQKNGGGLNVDPNGGDFEDDGIRYRVRHVNGSAGISPTHTYASTGAA